MRDDGLRMVERITERERGAERLSTEQPLFYAEAGADGFELIDIGGRCVRARIIRAGRSTVAVQLDDDGVHEPRKCVEKADQLVARVVQRLAESFSQERSRLEDQWSKGEDVSTEDLRIALQRYRSFFDRLLSV